MPRTKKNAEETIAVAAQEAVAAAEAPVEEAAEAEAPKKRTRKTTAKTEKKAEEKKPAAKKTESKSTSKKTAVSENVYIQYNGSELTSAGLIEKAKAESGVKSPKKVDVYVKPEENMVYYVVDNNAGSFALFE